MSAETDLVLEWLQAIYRQGEIITEHQKLIMKTLTDLDTSIANLTTAVNALSAQPAAPDLTNEVAEIDALTAKVQSLVPVAAPAPAPAA